jgi:hypothetical protein
MTPQQEDQLLASNPLKLYQDESNLGRIHSNLGCWHKSAQTAVFQVGRHMATWGYGP